jgi:hypothetical protein
MAVNSRCGYLGGNGRVLGNTGSNQRLRNHSRLSGFRKPSSETKSDAVKYALCQNWAIWHLSRVPNPWDDVLNCLFKSYRSRHLLSWLERQQCFFEGFVVLHRYFI